jgi:hypothetical protein
MDERLKVYADQGQTPATQNMMRLGLRTPIFVFLIHKTLGSDIIS